MKLQPSDLILRFDARDDKVLLLVPRSPDELDTLKRFYEIPVAQEVAVSAFAKEIGVAVASFLHARHSDRFKVESKDASAIEGASDEEVTFEDVRLLIDRLGDSSTPADVDAVDTLLAQASKRGDRKAAKYLRETWPGLKAVFLRRISRGSPGQ
jgi:hypothetical protein